MHDIVSKITLVKIFIALRKILLKGDNLKIRLSGRCYR